TYFFAALSDGIPATPSISTSGSPVGTSSLQQGPSGPYGFTTPQPPPGRFLFSLVLCNDPPLGETVAGLATTQQGVELPPGIRQTRAAGPDRPPVVFGHHPVTLESSVTTAEPVIFDLDQTQARDLEALYAASPGVFLHHAAHTHRNKRTLAPGAPNVVFQEV